MFKSETTVHVYHLANTKYQ